MAMDMSSPLHPASPARRIAILVAVALAHVGAFGALTLLTRSGTPSHAIFSAEPPAIEAYVVLGASRSASPPPALSPLAVSAVPGRLTIAPALPDLPRFGFPKWLIGISRCIFVVASWSGIRRPESLAIDALCEYGIRQIDCPNRPSVSCVVSCLSLRDALYFITL